VPPVTDDELEDFVRRVALARARRSSTERMERAKTFGAKLFARS
jgi:hypothetical protein